MIESEEKKMKNKGQSVYASGKKKE